MLVQIILFIFLLSIQNGNQNNDPVYIFEITSLDKQFRHKVLLLFDILRDHKIDFRVTSTYRSREFNEELIRKGYPASPESKHLKGEAIDIWMDNSYHKFKALLIITGLGFRPIIYDLHLYPFNYGLIHVDDRYGVAFNKIKRLKEVSKNN